MVSLTFYGGAGEIGGNKILLEDGETRLFFDFGTSFKKRAKYFEEYLNPRPGAGLLDLLELGLLPPLKGLLRDDLATPELWQQFESSPLYRELRVDGVLLSHAHTDHSGYISFLNAEIPIYATTMTAFIAKAMQDSGPTNFEREVCYLNLRELKDGYYRLQGDYKLRPYVFLDQGLLGQEALEFWNSAPTKKKKLAADSILNESGKIGRLNLKFFPVDHSIPGAAAFAVESSSGWIAYTGDLRLHGKRGEQTKKFAEELYKLRPYILLCEGTRLEDRPNVSEEEVYDNCLKTVREAKGLVIADFGPRNIERLFTFYEIACRTQRNLLILAKDAYLLDAMHLASTEIPRIEDLPCLLIYKDFKSRFAFWEEKLYERYRAKIISSGEIRQRPQDFILCFSFWDINDLVDIAPRGGTYIYSSSEVFDEEGAMDIWRLNNWLSHFGMKAVGLPREELKWEIPPEERGFHASGHAGGADLVNLIRQIKPQILIPIHTENPGYFEQKLKGTGIKVLIPSEGQTISFL